jgi:hypothetical protein
MSVPRSGPLSTADRLKKLRAMSGGELWTRVRYDAYCRLERARHARGALSSPDRLRAALVPTLARSSDWKSALLDARRNRTTRFFKGAEQLEATRARLLERFPGECGRARLEAGRVLRGEFSFFGGTYHYPAGVDWHADPVTGAAWPRVYHRDVPVHGGDVGCGDVKHVWELGRHQFVIDLAKVWAIDRDVAAAAAARALVSDWRRENPVGTGVGWSCSLEPAFRAMSWLWGYFLTLDDPSLNDDSHAAWLEGFHDHGWFIYRHLEYYTSPYNHLMGEACTLYALGLLFPEFAEAPKWRAHARELLETRLRHQFHRDGGSVEQSTFYHHATTGFYLLAALLGRANGDEFSTDVWRAIERGIEFSMLMQQPDGSTPRIGGADDGKPIRLEHLPLWDFRPYQAIGAVLFDRPDFKASAGRFFEDALWLLGTDGADRFAALAAVSPRPSHAFEKSGYVVMRNLWSTDADYVCFDCGEQAAGLRRDAIPSAAHGHADCLSIVLWRRGLPVLVDAGFLCYNGPKPWQDHFRETAAHNTVRIDGRDQAVHINKMAWSHTYTATLEGFDVSAVEPWAIGSHDGYRALERGPVVHRRAVWMRRRGYVVICDLLEGTGMHDIEVIFQFAPGAVRITPGCATFDDRARLHWFGSVPMEPRLYQGGPSPEDGWIAPSLGVKTPAPRLVLAASMTLPATIVSIVTDAASDGIQVSRGPDESGAPVRIGGGDWEDWLAVRGHDPGGSHALETDGVIGAWSREGEAFVADGTVGGTFQRP